MKLFLDDIRNPRDCVSYMHKRIGALNPIYLEEWYIVRNFEQFQKAIGTHYKDITHVSFDHDLADEHYSDKMYEGKEIYNEYTKTFSEKTGYHCAKWMKDFYNENNIELPTMFVHSMNPVGTENIINIIKLSCNIMAQCTRL